MCDCGLDHSVTQSPYLYPYSDAGEPSPTTPPVLTDPEESNDYFEYAQTLLALTMGCTTKPRPQNVVVGTGVMKNFNPLLTNDVTEVMLSEHLYLPLYDVGFNPDTNQMTYTPVLAADLPTRSEDGKSLTLKLGDHIHWSDGVPMTVDDIAFSYDLFHDQRINPTVSQTLKPVTITTNPDTREVTFTFANTTNFAEQMSLITYRSPIPKHIFEKADRNHFGAFDEVRLPTVVNGPFQIVAFDPGSYLKLQKNPHYTGVNPAKLELIVFKFYAEGDENATLVDFFTGASQMLPGVSIPNMQAIVNFGIDFQQGVMPTYNKVTFMPWNLLNPQDYHEKQNLAEAAYNARIQEIESSNLSDAEKEKQKKEAVALKKVDLSQVQPHPILADVQVRRALAKAFDVQRFVDDYFTTTNGTSQARIARGPFSPAGCNDCYEENLPYYDFDLEQAANELEALGWVDLDGNGYREKDVNGNGRYDDGVDIDLALTFVYDSTSYIGGKIAQITQANMKQIGVQLFLSPLDSVTRKSRVKNKDFDLALVPMTFSMPVEDISVLYTCGHPFNFSSYCDAELSEELNTAFHETNHETAQQNFVSSQTKIYEEQMMPIPFFTSSFFASSSNLQGVNPDFRSSLNNMNEWYLED